MEIVLTVEDDEDVRDYIKMYLLEWGHTVIEAGSGEGALLALDRLIPDLVLLDIGLPDLSGFDVVNKIAGDEKYEGLKIVALTAADDDESRDHANELGFAGYLTKPIIDPDDIRVMMERHLPADRL